MAACVAACSTTSPPSPSRSPTTTTAQASSPWTPAAPLAVVTGGRLRILVSGVDHDVASGTGVSDLSWSHDGTWLAFQRTAPDGAVTLFAVRSNGTDLREVGSVSTSTVAWSSTTDELLIGGSAPFAKRSALRVVRPGGHSRLVAHVPGTIESISAAGPELAVSTARFAHPNGFASATLLLRSAAGSRWRTVARSSVSSFEIDGFAPGGKTLLYEVDPSNSASIAADGLRYRVHSVAAGRTRSIGIGLVFSWWRSWAPSGKTLAITLGGSRAAWATDKHVSICALASSRCRSISSPQGTISFAPSYGTGGRLAYVTAEGLGGPGGFGKGQPEGKAGARRWESTSRVWAGASPATAHELRALGPALAPQWVGGGPGLLVARSGALWYLPSVEATVVRVTESFLPMGYGDHGVLDWSSDYALAP